MAIIAKNLDSVNTVTIKISASKSVDVGALASVNLLNEERTRSELAGSEDLALKIKDETIIINDGTQDLSWLSGLDLVRDYRSITDIDPHGRWIIRMDSKPKDWDTVFVGSGDDINNKIIGAGQEIAWDFSVTDNDEPSPLAGYKQKNVNWQFIDGVFIKEGAVYFFNAPKGSYLDFYVIAPTGSYYKKYFFDASTQIVSTQTAIASEDTIINHWVSHYLMEGNSPMGDELNTESAADNIAPEYLLWRVVITVPDEVGYQDFHGHANLEMYRPRGVIFPV